MDAVPEAGLSSSGAFITNEKKSKGSHSEPGEMSVKGKFKSHIYGLHLVQTSYCPCLYPSRSREISSSFDTLLERLLRVTDTENYPFHNKVTDSLTT